MVGEIPIDIKKPVIKVVPKPKPEENYKTTDSVEEAEKVVETVKNNKQNNKRKK